MITLFEFLQSDIAIDLSVSLLHTLWQGAVITGLLYLGLKAIPEKRSQWRYRFSIVSLFAIVLCWLVTFSILQYEPPPESGHEASIVKATVITDSPGIADKVKAVETIATVHQQAVNMHDAEAGSIGLGWLMVIWSVGLVVMLVRMFRSLAGTAKLRRDAVDIEDGALKELFEKLCAQMNITQKIHLAATKVLKHPGVVGFWRPVLLVPVSILNELPMGYLEAIIAHELAHIRRYDYLVNFCQMLVEAIFFFNPAVWWISRQIRLEREVCCDVAGIEATGRRVQYAQILFDQLCRNSQSAQSVTTAAITGFSDGNGSLSSERVRRIIDPRHKPQMRIGRAKLALLIGIAGVAIIGIWKTADVTVRVATKILTPQERVGKIAEIEKKYAPDYDGPATIEISGKVSTFDGSTPKNWRVMTVSGNVHTSIGR